ncbi:unnamed protein product [Cylindrotheca closterium]|uniref:Uncharacterized protein n=1 Tax=Cylindrotheca closterium TaxID=2856 RepID=A0AAD2FBL8_9STRA|nr:unnamed protein product [Cylindrotheca closterium]
MQPSKTDTHNSDYPSNTEEAPQLPTMQQQWLLLDHSQNRIEDSSGENDETAMSWLQQTSLSGGFLSPLMSMSFEEPIETLSAEQQRERMLDIIDEALNIINSKDHDDSDEEKGEKLTIDSFLSSTFPKQ